MKKILLIPMIFNPLWILFLICGLLFGFLWEFLDSFDMPGIFVLVLMLFLYNGISFICTLIYTILDYKNGDPLKSSKTAMIVKLIQIPFYLVIFVSSMVLLLGLIFTIGFEIAFLLNNCFCVFLSGMLTIPAWSNGGKYIKKSDSTGWILMELCQFILTIDVLVAIVMYAELKRAINRYNKEQEELINKENENNELENTAV